ncbi:MAG: hypothetical protein GY708_08245 [Actinomycetia bacterium]|nr:hypothetical protein [Actinomycetes bacterium]MCP4963429.1 hypothetical protein [Actinomycetes bacterium]
MTSPGVCFGGPSPEHDISVLTGLQAAHALAATGENPVALYWSKSGDWYRVPASVEAGDFADGLPSGAEQVSLGMGSDGGFQSKGRRGKRQPLDVGAVVNCCHGGPGENGTLQAMFDLAGVRYTGPSMPGAALGMDKLAFAGAMAGAGLPTLRTWALTPTVEIDHRGPLIVKPRFGGSSIGIEVVSDLATAKALATSQPLLQEGAVVQPYFDGAVDLNVSIKTCPTLELSVVERPLRGDNDRIYTYVEKYLAGGDQGMASAAREMPAQIDPELEGKLRTFAAAVVDVALVRSVARLDFLLVGDDLLVNEINTIPGSLSWYFWAHEGITFATLLRQMLVEAAKGPTRRLRTDGADGTALRSAGAMARKLA